MRLRWSRECVLVALGAWMLASPFGLMAQPTSKVEVRGRLVDLTSTQGKTDSTNKAAASGKIVGLKTKEGTVHRLARTTDSEALFTDRRLWDKDLILIGFAPKDGRGLEVSLIRSVRDGKIYDLYYWCEICAIKTMVPGPCPCCRDDVELRETLLESRTGSG